MGFSLRLPLPLAFCFLLLACSPPASQAVGPSSGPDTGTSTSADVADEGTLPQIVTLGESYSDELIQLYNEDGTLWHAYSYKYDDSDGEYEYYNSEFLPLAFHPDYYTLAMVCLKENEDYYFVQVDATGTIKKVPKTAALKAVSLADYFGGQASVAVVNPLRTVGGNAAEKTVEPGTYTVISASGNTAVLRDVDSDDMVRVAMYMDGKINLQPLLD